MTKTMQIVWAKKPKGDDYVAAEVYLSLIFEPKVATELVRRLRKASVTRYLARDILRASAHLTLGIKAADSERKAILGGEAISPLLLVRNPQFGRLVVADGYHRACTIYTMDEDALVDCKIV